MATQVEGQRARARDNAAALGSMFGRCGAGRSVQPSTFRLLVLHLRVRDPGRRDVGRDSRARRPRGEAHLVYRRNRCCTFHICLLYRRVCAVMGRMPVTRLRNLSSVERRGLIHAAAARLKKPAYDARRHDGAPRAPRCAYARRMRVENTAHLSSRLETNRANAKRASNYRTQHRPPTPHTP